MLTRPRWLLQAEGAPVFAAMVAFYAHWHVSWWLFAVLILVPDISIAGLGDLKDEGREIRTQASHVEGATRETSTPVQPLCRQFNIYATGKPHNKIPVFIGSTVGRCHKKRSDVFFAYLGGFSTNKPLQKDIEAHIKPVDIAQNS